MVHNSSSTTDGVHRDLIGRRVLVTGASRGIGAAIVRRLSAAGARVVGVARSVPGEVPDGVEFVAGDVRTQAGVEAIADAAIQRLGGVDVIVNNAGASRTFPEGARSIPADEWRDVLDVTLMAPVWLNAALLPQMLERESGAIVHIASSAAFNVPGPLLHYGAAKAALIAYSKGLATELAGSGVRVNTITPGNVETPGADEVREHLATGFGVDVATINSVVPLGRIGRPEEIAEAVAYLVSDRAGYVVGANLVIDGGEQTRP
jgi:NAD(P)-dependent dehydrogenase (short-subunit alcohol dehydrogenase family)